jgi:hypothetical protein
LREIPPGRAGLIYLTRIVFHREEQIALILYQH